MDVAGDRGQFDRAEIIACGQIGKQGVVLELLAQQQILLALGQSIAAGTVNWLS